jgi:hypothetical protein
MHPEQAIEPRVGEESIERHPHSGDSAAAVLGILNGVKISPP